MKKIVIFAGVVILLSILLYAGFRIMSGGLVIGGGGSQQYAPDEVQAGEIAEITVVVTATGGGGDVMGRFKDISLHYRLVGATEYVVAQPQQIVLPDNFKTVQSKTFQSEAYKFTIPPYPVGTAGEIEYYTAMTFDGNPSRQEGVKKIKVTSTLTSNGAASSVDYDELKKNCDSGCCEQSVETMKAHQYPRYIGKCPVGYQKNQLLCVQSVAWCEPVASSSPAI